MVSKKIEANEPRAINPDGSLAPRPGMGYDTLAPTGLPPKGGIDIPVNPGVDLGDVLPFVSVARAVVGRRVSELRGTLAHIDRELEVTSPFSVNGQPNPYMLDRIAGLRESRVQAEAEIEHLNGLSDHEARIWAKQNGYR